MHPTGGRAGTFDTEGIWWASIGVCVMKSYCSLIGRLHHRGGHHHSSFQYVSVQGLESGQLTEASAEAFFEAKKGQITESLWKLNVLDIEGTLTRVVGRVRAGLCLLIIHKHGAALWAVLRCAVLGWAGLCCMLHAG